MFRGTTPPLLKKGEWASDGNYAYLGMEHGEYKVFQGVFDLSKDQQVTGFNYDLDRKAIVIPSGTPFSELQKLFDTLPKALKYTADSKASIDILFEDGTYINDLGGSLVLRDFNYQINICSLSNTEDEETAIYAKPIVFEADNAIEVYNSTVSFSDIRFAYSNVNFGALSIINSSVNINDCCFDSKAGGICVTDNGYNRIVFTEVYFKMFTDEQFAILNKASVGSVINIARSKSDENFRPKSVALWLYGGMIIVGNASSVHIKEKSQFDPTFGGIEIHNGFVTDIDGNVDVDIPTKLSDLENDAGFASSYDELENKPTTISSEQATAIESNSEKRSYPESDQEKLSNIETSATNGADWDANVANKPTTISPEQATAIESNSEKRSYPESDQEKLSNIENNATNGADWDANVANKPTTISQEQSAAIESNTSKNSYPKSHSEKLSEIEEKATAGADWDTNIENKPTIATKLSELENDTGFTDDYDELKNKPAIPSKLSDLENDLTIKKLADFDPDNDNHPATCKAIANWNTGAEELTESLIDWKGKPIINAAITEDTTFSFSNLVANKKLTIIAKGDFQINFPSYCKQLESSSDYDGYWSNFIELICTNDKANNKEVWYNITREKIPI